MHTRTHRYQRPAPRLTHSLPGRLPDITLISDELASALRDKVEDWRHYATALIAAAAAAAAAGSETETLHRCAYNALQSLAGTSIR